MTSRWLLSLGLVVALAGLPAPLEAGWIWSPQTGWIGPSGAVKDTPEEQLAHALNFFGSKDYNRARIECKKLLSHYKDSPQASEAQYYLGRCEEEMGDYYRAFVDYRKTIEAYPSTARFDELLERMFQIGNYFLGGKRRKLLGTIAILPARDKAIEIFQAIAEAGPFSQHGELAQYKVGVAYLALGEYEQAVSAFEQLIERHPKSSLVAEARFQLAQASLKGTFKPDYDQHPTDQAIEKLQTFAKEYPTNDLSPEAVQRVQTLREHRAQHEFQIGQFYERRKEFASALLYYQGLVANYSNTSWAPKAVSRIQILEPKVP